MELQTFETALAATTISFYLLALAFDIVVSYSVYSTHSEYFFNLEQNEEFIRLIRVGAFPFKMLVWFCVAMLPALFCALEKKFKRDVFDYLLIPSVIITIYISTVHLEGGLSWWGT